MSDSHQCPRCGALLPSGVLQGLCPACLLQEGAAAESISQPGAPFTPPQLEEIARLFPQLEIISLLGKGGMGAVYKARQPALERFIALKILAPQPADGRGFADRFNREARALARLSHPTIVAVHEFGEAGGMHYFIMEYVDGVNLRQLERAGQLSPREALQIVPQLCDALQYAHDEGVVHRDIKPENILIDRKGRVKIADFGLAKVLGLSGEALRLTAEGHVMGTPHYMAPEQVEHPLEVDHRADIYSLGVVFYEMLTGELPLGKFAPPSERMRGVRVDVRLDAVVLRALEKQPELRYQQASQVKTGVQNIEQPLAAPTGRDIPALAAIWGAIFLPFVFALLAFRGRWGAGWTALGLSLLLIAAATAVSRLRGNPAGKKEVNAANRSSLAIVWLVGGIAAVIFLIFGLIVAAIAIPAYQKARSSRVNARKIETQAAGNDLPLTQGSIRLVAISEHPSQGKPWWTPDGALSREGPFENAGAHSYPSPDQQAREFVFRAEDLPPDASTLTWKIDDAGGWAGGGAPMRHGIPAPGYDLIAASLPTSAHTARIRAGVAYGPWETISENEGVGTLSSSTSFGGSTWSVAFLAPIEKKDGTMAMTVSYTVAPERDDQVRLAAVDKAGREHTATLEESQHHGPLSHLTVVFSDLPADQVKSLRLQARPYRWVTFHHVALDPDPRQAGAAAEAADNK